MDSKVARGQPLIQAEDPFLRTRVAVLQAQMQELSAQYDAMVPQDRVQAAMVREEMQSVAANLKRARERQSELILRSPARGRRVVPGGAARGAGNRSRGEARPAGGSRQTTGGGGSGAKFCANCGAETGAVDGGHERRCPECGAHHFPRTDPAAIVRVVDGDDRLLLGLKGSLNEYELDLLRQRSLAARYEKARRGELGVAPPGGFATGRRPPPRALEGATTVAGAGDPDAEGCVDPAHVDLAVRRERDGRQMGPDERPRHLDRRRPRAPAVGAAADDERRERPRQAPVPRRVARARAAGDRERAARISGHVALLERQSGTGLNASNRQMVGFDPAALRADPALAAAWNEGERSPTAMLVATLLGERSAG